MSPPPMTGDGAVLVIGASGTTGRPLVSLLRDAGAEVRAASRRTSAPEDANGVRFDWSDPGTHAAALDGVKGIYAIPPVGEPAPERVMMPFLTRARGRGVRRVVLLSNSVTPSGAPGVGLVHEALPRLFEEWAVLRPTWFMQDFLGAHPYAQMIDQTHTLPSDTDGARVAFIDALDIAAAAAGALLKPAAGNDEFVLTGPAALSFSEVAEQLSHATSRPVVHARVPRDTLAEQYEAIGVAPASARFVAIMDSIIATGSEDQVTDGVQRLTGRAPHSFAQFLAANSEPRS